MRFIALMVIAVVVTVVILRYSDVGGDNANSRDERLSRSFRARSGINFRYPDGWVIEEVEGITRIANRAEAFTADPPNPGDFLITIRPPIPKDIVSVDPAMTSVLNAFGRSLGGGTSIFGPATAVEIGDRPAARAALNTPPTEGIALGLPIPNEQSVVIVIARGASGTLTDHERTVLDIADTIRYNPPGAQPTPTP